LSRSRFVLSPQSRKMLLSSDLTFIYFSPSDRSTRRRASKVHRRDGSSLFPFFLSLHPSPFLLLPPFLHPFFHLSGRARATSERHPSGGGGRGSYDNRTSSRQSRRGFRDPEEDRDREGGGYDAGWIEERDLPAGERRKHVVERWERLGGQRRREQSDLDETCLLHHSS